MKYYSSRQQGSLYLGLLIHFAMPHIGVIMEILVPNTVQHICQSAQIMDLVSCIVISSTSI